MMVLRRWMLVSNAFLPTRTQRACAVVPSWMFGLVPSLALSLVLSSSLSACASLHGRDELDLQMFQHHNNLRWGRLGNAALAVKPEMREAFVTHWSARASQVELQEMEVAGVMMTGDGGAADVIVNIVYVDRATMQVKSASLRERWVRTDAGWLVESPITLSEESQALEVRDLGGAQAEEPPPPSLP